MKKIALVSLLLASSAFASAQDFLCTVNYNLETVIEEKFTLQNDRITFGNFEAFNFHLQKKADGRIELQASNMDDPSRSYATATIKNAGDNVQLSVWTNNYLIDARCTLVGR